MTASSQPVPELEVRMLLRRSERRQEALKILREPAGLRRTWAMALGALMVGPQFALSKFGDGFAAFLGLTTEGLSWSLIFVMLLLVLSYQVFLHDRKVEALRRLLLDELEPGQSLGQAARRSGDSVP